MAKRLTLELAPPFLAGVFTQPVLWLFDVLLPAADGSYGAPIAYGSTGTCYGCVLESRFTGTARVDWPALALDILITFAVFLIVARWTRIGRSPLPFIGSLAAIGIGLLVPALLHADLDRDGIAWPLWALAVAGYVVGAVGVVIVRWARRFATDARR